MTKTPDTKPQSRSTGLRGLAYRMLGGVSVVLLSGAAVYGAWNYLTHRPEFMVYPSTFQLQTPPWASKELAAKISEVKGLKDSYSIFEPGLTRKIAKAYAASPWVYEVLEIKREFPNKIKMRLSLRKPVVVVRMGHRYCLADDDAVRLPKNYYLWPHPAMKLPMLLRDGLTELPDPGKAWQDRGVRAGACLAKFLRDRGMLDRFKITTIDASNVSLRPLRDESPIVLLTEDHTKILWGSPSIEKRPGELTGEQKLANLITVAQAEHYDFSRLEYVDVRWEKPVARRRQIAPAQP